MPLPEHKFQYQQIAGILKSQIMRGEIRPGSRLASERLLSQQFQVQRNTVRQALTVLKEGGFIATGDRRGYFAAQAVEKRGDTFLINARTSESLFTGFRAGAAKAGFRVVSISTVPVGDSIVHPIPDPADLPEGTAGIFLWPSFPTDSKRIQKLYDAIPLVFMDRRVPGVPADCIHFDDLEGGRMITEHLLSLGHRKIVFLTDEVFADTVRLRWHGYVLALEGAGIAHEPRLSLLYQTVDSDVLASAIRMLMADTGERPTAIVCSNDLVAVTLLRVLHKEQIRVPEDLAVTGYGNAFPDYTAAMTLTTVDQNFSNAGFEAAKILSERTIQPLSERIRLSRDVALPVHIIARESTVSR